MAMTEMNYMSGSGYQVAEGSFTTNGSTDVVDCPCGFVPDRIYLYKIAFNGSATGNYVAVYDKSINANKQYNIVSSNATETAFPTTVTQLRLKGLTSNGFEFKFNTPSSSESKYWGTYYWVAMK